MTKKMLIPIMMKETVVVNIFMGKLLAKSPMINGLAVKVKVGITAKGN